MDLLLIATGEIGQMVPGQKGAGWLVAAANPVVALLLTTKEQVTQTVAGVAGYGGSLDVILDDAEEEQP